MLVAISRQSGFSAGAAIASITYNGSPLTLSYTAAASFGTQYIYYILAPTSGSNPLQVNFVSDSDNSQWVIQEQVYSGVDQVNPLGAYASANNSPASFTENITTTGPASLVTDILYNNQQNFPTSTGTGQVVPGGLSGGGNLHMYSDYKDVGGPGLPDPFPTPGRRAARPSIRSSWRFVGSELLSPTNTPSPTPIQSKTNTPTATPSFSPQNTSTATPTDTPRPSPTVTMTPPPPFLLSLLPPSPNPFGDTGVHLAYYLGDAAQVTIVVYDVSGEKVTQPGSLSRP